jgi:hypothetical protein
MTPRSKFDMGDVRKQINQNYECFSETYNPAYYQTFNGGGANDKTYWLNGPDV